MNSNIVFLSLGSNIGEKKKNLNKALFYLEEEKIRIMKKSSFYKTEAIGPKQDFFLNMAVKVATKKPAQLLLQVTQKIEKKMGRQKTFHWGPRLIDIDILTFNNINVDTLSLTLPHPQMLIRRFVLEPLFEIEKNFTLPNNDKTLLYFFNQSMDQPCEKI